MDEKLIKFVTEGLFEEQAKKESAFLDEEVFSLGLNRFLRDLRNVISNKIHDTHGVRYYSFKFIFKEDSIYLDKWSDDFLMLKGLYENMSPIEKIDFLEDNKSALVEKAYNFISNKIILFDITKQQIASIFKKVKEEVSPIFKDYPLLKPEANQLDLLCSFALDYFSFKIQLGKKFVYISDHIQNYNFPKEPMSDKELEEIIRDRINTLIERWKVVQFNMWKSTLDAIVANEISTKTGLLTNQSHKYYTVAVEENASLSLKYNHLYVPLSLNLEGLKLVVNAVALMYFVRNNSSSKVLRRFNFHLNKPTNIRLGHISVTDSLDSIKELIKTLVNNGLEVDSFIQSQVLTDNVPLIPQNVSVFLEELDSFECNNNQFKLYRYRTLHNQKVSMKAFKNGKACSLNACYKAKRKWKKKYQ